MTKYYVVDYKGRDCIYEGFDKEVALKTWYGYNKACCGDWYLEEEEIEDPEELETDYTELAWYENEELTSIWGDDEAIKATMKEWIEGYVGCEVVDFELEYSDPGDSGDEADFIAHKIIYKEEK